MIRVVAVFLAFALGFAALPAAADSLSEPDRTAIQGLITGQINAFQKDDGATAYGLAAPSIHSIFPTVEMFMEMVKTGYLPVYRPQSVTFGELVDTAFGPVQKVYLTGPDGLGYVAIYSMEREADGTWKISGCTILKDDRPSI